MKTEYPRISFIRHVFLIAIWVFSHLAMAQAQGATLEFSPGALTVVSGQSLLLDVVISDLGSETVGGFDLNVQYDSSVLQLGGVSFGPGLGNPGLFDAIADSRTFSMTQTEQVVNFSEISFLDDFNLSSLQGNSLTLATLRFQGAGIGSSPLLFRELNASEIPPSGIPLQVHSGSGAPVALTSLGTAVVTVEAVPEPQTFFLLLTGLLGLLMWRVCCTSWL